MMSATVLVPAQDDLLEAHAFRDKALALESYRASVLSRHTAYLQALEARDETVLLDLAASQLNLVPKDQTVLLAPSVGADAPVSVLASLDVPYVRPEPPVAADTMLHRLTAHPRARMLIFAACAVAILYGLLPASMPSSESTRARRRSRDGEASGPTMAVRSIAHITGAARARLAGQAGVRGDRAPRDGRAA